jgi:hypothetical protein
MHDHQKLCGLMKGDIMPQKTLSERIADAKKIKDPDEKILTLALLLPPPEVEKFVQFLTRLHQSQTKRRYLNSETGI